MAGLSFCRDGSSSPDSLPGITIRASALPSVEPAAVPGATSDPEAVLRGLFNEIVMEGCSVPASESNAHGSMSGGLGIKIVPGPSPNLVSVEFSDSLTSLIQRMCGTCCWEDAGSREHIEGLVCKILNEKMAKPKELCGGDGHDVRNMRGSSESVCSSGESTATCNAGPLRDMVMWVREVASDPCDLEISAMMDQESRKWWNPILNTRRVLFQRIEYISNVEEAPYRKRRRIHRYLCGTPRETAEMRNQPTRRSQRALGMLKLGEGHLPRKRVPVGPFFQVDVPEWTGTPTASCDYPTFSDPKWLGTRTWPIESGKETSAKRSSKEVLNLCYCKSPRSINCIKHHVKMARLQLNCELGQAFSSMGFDDMGEEVSNSWSRDEQMNFDNLVKRNPLSENKTFWDPALRCFPSKSRKTIVSYYFNVHVLRRMSVQTRMAYLKVDSDDDECG